MSLLDASLIQQRYEQNEYFYYPEMEKLIDNVVSDPTVEIVIPDDFATKSLETSNILLCIVQKIKIFFKKFFKNCVFFFSSTRSTEYNLAIKKIQDAYCSKVAVITRLRDSLIGAKNAHDSVVQKIAPLKRKIHRLEKQAQTENDRLQENIDTKNLIVQQARELYAKRNKPPEADQPKKSLFSKLAKALTTNKKLEPEARAIKELDPSFPLENLTDDFINDYDNEESEEINQSPFIQELKASKAQVLSIQDNLTAKQQKLEKLLNEEGEALENLKKTTEEIKTLDLENYFNEADLTASALPAQVSDEELTAKEIILTALRKDIKSKTHNTDLATLYATLISRLPENAITRWNCDPNGNFTLILNKPYRIWVPEADYQGGVILLLGPEIKGHLEFNKILFSAGMSNYVKVLLIGYIEPTIIGIDFRSKLDVQIGGTYLMSTQWNKRTYSSLKKDWGHNGIVIGDDYPGGYQKYLENEINK